MRTTRAPICLFLAGFAAACGRAEPPSGAPLDDVVEVLRVEVSGEPRPRSWVVGSEAQWLALWQRIPASEKTGQQIPAVDLAREMIVAVAGGTGRSGSPDLKFEGYRAHGDTTDVQLRIRSCGAAEDVIQLLIAGSVPRRAGPVRLIQQRHEESCDDF